MRRPAAFILAVITALSFGAADPASGRPWRPRIKPPYERPPHYSPHLPHHDVLIDRPYARDGLEGFIRSIRAAERRNDKLGVEHLAKLHGPTRARLSPIKSESVVLGENYGLPKGDSTFLSGAYAEKAIFGPGKKLHPSVAVVNFLPSTASDFIRVFDEAGSAAEVAAYRRGFEAINAIGKTVVFDADAALHSQSDIIVFVAHNDNGVMRAPSKIDAGIEYIAKRCEQLGKVCIYIACNSADYLTEKRLALTRPIKPDEAARITLHIARIIEDEPVIGNSIKYPGHALDRMTALFDDRYIGRVYVRKATSGTAILLIALVLSCDDDPCPASVLEALRRPGHKPLRP